MFEKSFSILKNGLVSLLVCLAGLFSCTKSAMVSVPVEVSDSRNIAFEVEDESVDTKVTVVNNRSLQSSGFKVSATTGSSGSEVSVWNNVSFSLDGGYYTGGKYWPTADPSYHFYASNIAIIKNADGCRVSATNDNDVVCAYIDSPYYQVTNMLQFEHIFARIGTVGVSASGGYTISGIQAKLYPKTGGTYNIRTGSGQTDASGWVVVSVSSNPTNIANSVPGEKSNDLYLVPGSYDIEFSWNASKNGVTHSYTKTINVNLVKGKINSITATLSGDDELIQFNIMVREWADNRMDFGNITPAD